MRLLRKKRNRLRVCPQRVKNRGWECTLHESKPWGEKTQNKGWCAVRVELTGCREVRITNMLASGATPAPPRAITSHLSKSHTDALACTIHAYIWSFPGPGLILPPTNTQRRVDRGCKQIIQVEENSSFTGRLQRAGAKRVCETHKGVGEQDTR